MSKKTASSVIVIGGGLAGLTAAKRLIDSGFNVSLYEGRKLLGGKISAWQDKDNDWVESGLHVFFGAYEEIYELMKELNLYQEILWKEHVLTYTLDQGIGFEFRTIKLPSPFHLLPAVFQNQYFGWVEKFSLARALYPMLFGSDDYFRSQDIKSYSEWHKEFGISQKMLKKMFLPMSLALKFLPPEELSAKIVLDVSGTFLRTPTASKMGFLSGSPAEKLTNPLAKYITDKGGKIYLNSPIEKLIFESGEIKGALLKNGETLKADYYLLALPIHKLQEVLPERLREESFFNNLYEFEGVPVITAQLWFNQQVTGVNNILFSPDGVIPVYADLGNTTPDYSCQGKSRVEAVVAPARHIWDWDDKKIVLEVFNNIQSYFPKRSTGAKVIKSTVVRIPKSVYWPKPGVDKLRPTQKTPIKNLFLAGGYTEQRFYDSMEGAVSSGNRAAKALMERVLEK
ncbi:MAG: FAD-dependent oxidoreductase [Acidobacteria bacterium]|nr:FAD-dependent oxidoreductase [Acidobacteriota bacterium]